MAFYQCDHLGTPQELTDHEGRIAWSASYKAWGEAKQAISEAGRRAGFRNPIRFQGQYFDDETGLHYNRYRYYDPVTGRFVSSDPIALLGGLHAYTVNPVQWTDPTGLASQWQANWEEKYGPLPSGYQVHHVIPKSASSVAAAKKLCPNFDVHNVDNLIALPKDSSVAQINGNGAGFGKTTHYGYHAGYSAAAEVAMAGAARFKGNGGSGCTKLKVVQTALRTQLSNGGLTMYGNQHPNGVPGVTTDWKNSIKDNIRAQ
ncbi:RHS domain-containing protein [Variovorax sp. VRV01]|nr:RHS domain-containing protein [Variovorax sp. VRV01]